MRKGVGSWLLERATAVVLLPLTVWFVVALIAHSGDNHAALISWLHSPLNAVLMALLLIALFWHTALGMGVVIKDYVHVIHQRAIALVALRVACVVFTVAGVAAVACIALTTA